MQASSNRNLQVMDRILKSFVEFINQNNESIRKLRNQAKHMTYQLRIFDEMLNESRDSKRGERFPKQFLQTENQKQKKPDFDKEISQQNSVTKVEFAAQKEQSQGSQRNQPVPTTNMETQLIQQFCRTQLTQVILISGDPQHKMNKNQILKIYVKWRLKQIPGERKLNLTSIRMNLTHIIHLIYKKSCKIERQFFIGMTWKNFDQVKRFISFKLEDYRLQKTNAPVQKRRRVRKGGTKKALTKAEDLHEESAVTKETQDASKDTDKVKNEFDMELLSNSEGSSAGDSIVEDS